MTKERKPINLNKQYGISPAMQQLGEFNESISHDIKKLKEKVINPPKIK